MKRIILLAIILSTTQLFAQNLKFGDINNISALPLKQEKSINESFNAAQNINFQIPKDQLSSIKFENFDAFTAEGFTSSGNPGEPTTYLVSKRIELNKNQQVVGVRLKSGSYVEINETINLLPVKQLQTYANNESNIWITDKAIYSKDELFPGRSVDFISGSDGKKTIAYVKFFPIQYNPVTKKAYLITEAEFEICYSEIPAMQIKNTSKNITSENIIIAPFNFKAAADSLKSLHENFDGVSTSVITTGWIDSNYVAAEDPTVAGFATIANNPINSNYNYELAKKITAFLRDDAYHPNLVSVTLLGDALEIPPSYYFYKFWADDTYTDWQCSDLFYTSPDYDFIPNFQIGRLPVNNLAEAEQIVNKLKNWKTNLDESWFNNVNLIGGVPFETPLLYGEVITLDVVNSGYLEGKNITKYFSSNGTETRSAVLPMFSDENTGMIFHIGHGSGTAIALEQGSVSYSDMMALPAKEKYPIVVSIACMNGGYDAELINVAPFTNSLSEGMMRSQAGSIAYWGGVRNNAGAPNVTFQSNGEWVIGQEPLMAEMLTNLFKAYSEGNNTFGSINNTAFSEYMTNLNPNSSAGWATAFEFVFLGDPALSLLPWQADNITLPSMSVDPVANVPGGYEPPVYIFSTTPPFTLEFTASTNSASINQKVFSVSQTGGTNLKTSATVTNNNFLSEYTLQETNRYFVSYEASNFKETRLYFDGEKLPNIAPQASAMLEVQNQNGGNYDLSWTAAIDPDGTISHYNLFEGKNPEIVLDEASNFSNWNKKSFLVMPQSGTGHSSPNAFFSMVGNNDSSVLCSKYPVEVNEGDVLEFNVFYEIEENFDFLYLQIAEAGQAFETIETFTGSNVSWEHKSYNLNDYVDKQIYIKFLYQTDDDITGFGVYLDDIQPVKAFESTQLIEEISETEYYITGNSTGVYEYGVEAIDNEGTSSGFSNFITVDVENIGISKQQNQNNCAIYPNPAQDVLYVETAEDIHLSLYNLLGEKVLDKNIEKGRSSINLEKFESGCYFVKINGKTTQSTRKLVIN